jgi:hypothetical protein
MAERLCALPLTSRRGAIDPYLSVAYAVAVAFVAIGMTFIATAFQRTRERRRLHLDSASRRHRLLIWWQK